MPPVRLVTAARRALPAVLVLLLVTACGTAVPAPAPTSPRRTRADTLTRTDVGGRLVVTAGVHRVLSNRTFVVRDEDLPETGVLVLAPTWQLEPDLLVTVDGIVDRFRYDNYLAWEIGRRSLYEEYEGGKFLIASRVRVR